MTDQIDLDGIASRLAQIMGGVYSPAILSRPLATIQFPEMRVELQISGQRKLHVNARVVGLLQESYCWIGRIGPLDPSRPLEKIAKRIRQKLLDPKHVQDREDREARRVAIVKEFADKYPMFKVNFYGQTATFVSRNPHMVGEFTPKLPDDFRGNLPYVKFASLRITSCDLSIGDRGFEVIMAMMAVHVPGFGERME
jgi:hypothetical protein